MKSRKETKIDFKYNLATYWNLIKPYKWYFVTAIVLIIILQTEQLIERYILKLIIDNGSAYLSGTTTRDVLIQLFTILAIVFVSLQFFKVIIRWFKLTCTIHIGSNAIFDLKRKYFNHIISLDHNFHTTHRTGSLISKITRAGNAIDRLNDIFEHNTFPLLIQVIISTVAIAYFDFISALILIITMGLFIIYSLYIQNKQEAANIESNDAEDHEKAQISDYFMNVDSIKHFGKEENIKKQYYTISDHSKKTLAKYWSYFKTLEVGQSLIIGIGGFLILLFPILSFLDNKSSIGTISFIFATYIAISGQLWDFVSGIRGFYRSMADLQPLFAYGKIHNAIKDKKNAKDMTIHDGVVSFKNVSFAYHKRNIFKNFNLEISKNQKVALVGHSGSGKTTLTKLLYRFYDVDQGSITIDGININDVKQESLRSELSIVPQECILFDDTIYNNILFSNPNANKQDVWRAIKFAQLDALINRLPQKEQTIVGERGVKLSGGEKQRVSIARAILADKKILVLDEATSSLDSETEHEIQQDLKKLMQGRTSIIIAHRLSTIMHADKIVVMKNGKIVQMGSHNALIKQKGEYQKLWKLQKGGYIR